MVVANVWFREKDRTRIAKTWVKILGLIWANIKIYKYTCINGSQSRTLDGKGICVPWPPTPAFGSVTKQVLRPDISGTCALRVLSIMRCGGAPAAIKSNVKSKATQSEWYAEYAERWIWNDIHGDGEFLTWFMRFLSVNEAKRVRYRMCTRELLSSEYIH